MMTTRGIGLLAVLLLAAAAPPDSNRATPGSTPAGWDKAPAAKPSPHGTSPHGAASTATPAVPGLRPGGVAPKPPADPASASRPTTDGKPLRVKTLAIGIRHRVVQDFAEKVEARLKEEFRVGDSEYTAEAIEFVPDFVIENHKVISRSREPRNPAARIVVRENGAPHDTSWAFLNFPPHFSSRSILAFQLLSVEFENHEPVTARRDSAAAGRTKP